ncbi:MAG: hypothetical protein RI911_907 [Candidatus Parcubacteria bacterium]|jgi:hypothetical protein
MADQLQPTNNNSQEAERARRLADEIRQTTGIGLNNEEQSAAALDLALRKPQGMLHSMQDAVAAAQHAPAPQPQEPAIMKQSLSDALKDVFKQQNEPAEGSSVTLKKPPQAKPPEAIQINYREAIEEGTGLNLASTPINGVFQRDIALESVSKEAVIHTLKYDVQDLVKKKKVSMIRAVALENDRSANAQTISRPIAQAQHHSNVGVYILSTLFFFLGAIAIGAVIYAQGMKTEQRQAESQQLLAQNALLFFEHQKQFDVTDLQSYELKGGLAQIREQLTATLGSITMIQLTERPYDVTSGQYYTRAVDLSGFFKILKPRLPKQLASTLNPSEYMLGVHTSDETSPFLLLVGSSYDTSFAGMLAWEASLAKDLSPFFPNRGATSLSANASRFEDLAIDNIDARVLRAPNKKVRVLYAVLEKNVIAITNNIYTLKEIAARLHARTSNARGTGI